MAKKRSTQKSNVVTEERSDQEPEKQIVEEELTPAEARKRLLERRLNSATVYPKEQYMKWRLELRLIEQGQWTPDTPKRLPKIKTNFDKFFT